MNVTSLKQYRATQEEQVRAELADLQRALDQADAVRRRLEEAALDQVKTYLAQAKEGLTADEAIQWNELMARTADSVARACDAVADARQRLETKRLEALDAARETRKLAILEQRDIDRQQRIDLAKTQRELDEIAGRQFQARRKESHDAPDPR